VAEEKAGRRLAVLSVAVALVSGTLLAWEVALTRILAIRQWSHFAYLVISVALLGFGASGTLLALLGEWGRRHRSALLRGAAVLFVPSLPLSRWLIRFIPFDLNYLLMKPIGAPWQLLLLPFRSGWMVVLELVMGLPFLLGAMVIALGLLEAGKRVGRVYGANMLGSGLGAAAAVGLMYLARPGWLAAALVPSAIVAAALLTLGGGLRWRVGWVAGTLAGLALAWASALAVEPSQFKSLSTTELFPGSRVEVERWGPLSLLTLVSGPSIRLAPGMSLAYSTSTDGELPRQKAIFFDGDDPSPVLGVPQPPHTLAYLDYLPTAVAYHLLREPKVLVLGMGGGSEVLGALRARARSVTAVEVDPLVVEVVRKTCGDFTGHFLDRPEVTVAVTDARSFLEETPATFDLIQMPLLSGFGASAAGMFALSPTYLFTVEGLGSAVDRLGPEGVLAITRWDHYPERDAIRMLATVVEVAERRGLDPKPRLALYRGYATATILFSRRPWTEEQLEIFREVCAARGFDPWYYPGITAEEVNRFNQLEQPVYHLAARSILFGDRQDFYRARLFRTRPTTDQQPYFNSHLRWRSVPWLVKTLGTKWVHAVGRGYVFLVLALVETTALGAMLIVVPLFLLGRIRKSAGRASVAAYFLSLGLAYMLLEIAAIQRLELLLSSPVYSLAAVLATFLLGSGLGSMVADRFPGGPRRAILTAVIAVTVLVTLHVTLLPHLLPSVLGLGPAVRLSVIVVTLAPLAFFMGFPFPSGFALLRRRGEALAPWAWGVNGCASVVGASLATLFAVEFGLHTVMVLAAGLYVFALAVSGRLARVG